MSAPDSTDLATLSSQVQELARLLHQQDSQIQQQRDQIQQQRSQHQEQLLAVTISLPQQLETLVVNQNNGLNHVAQSIKASLQDTLQDLRGEQRSKLHSVRLKAPIPFEGTERESTTLINFLDDVSYHFEVASSMTIHETLQAFRQFTTATGPARSVIKEWTHTYEEFLARHSGNDEAVLKDPTLPDHLTSWTKIRTRFEQLFTNREDRTNARAEFRRLSQNTSTCLQFSTRFNDVIRRAQLSRDDHFVLDTYFYGLNYEVQWRITDWEDLTLDELQKRAEDLDARYRATHGARHHRTPFRQTPAFGQTTFTSRQPAPQVQLQPSQAVPMDVDAAATTFRGPLPHTERQRRFQGGLCMYCGSDKHRVAQCNKKHANSQPGTAAIEQTPFHKAQGI